LPILACAEKLEELSVYLPHRTKEPKPMSRVDKSSSKHETPERGVTYHLI